ncbi:hypothetical protein MMC34_008504, partial [Xylographa carneopallida]|nr:hypothetical protein [Xylographa carneopallida]
MSSPGRATLVRALLTTVSLLLAILATLCTAQPANSSSVPLVNDVPLLGSLAANAASYYTFSAPAVSYPQSAFISVAASTGSPSLYVSLFDLQPSASSFDYAASWQTGGVVSISSQPPYTAYVAVVASPYSATNYTLLVTVAIAAGEYRYFAYTVTNSSVTTTIALTEAYGQSWLLLNSPNTTQLPTVDSAQYASSDATFPLVALQQPAVGVWQVGVWSNASSAFTIIAADSTATTPVELDVTYPGYVQQGAYVYYSIYLDTVQFTTNNSSNVVIELLSLDSSDYDLCCDVVLSPMQYGSRWHAHGWHAPASNLIPASQLSSGTLYCGVSGWSDGSYLLSASLASAILLTAGETTTAQSAAGQSQLFSLVFPAVPTIVTLSVVSDVGRFIIYVSGWGEPPSNDNNVAQSYLSNVQDVTYNSSILCAADGSQNIPGSDPPLCQMQVLVNPDGLTLYHVTASTSGEVVGLTKGQPVLGVATPDQP